MTQSRSIFRKLIIRFEEKFHIYRVYTHILTDLRFNRCIAARYALVTGRRTKCEADDVTGLSLSHPATNRNVYFTRRKLTPRTHAKARRRHGCATSRLLFPCHTLSSSSLAVSGSCLPAAVTPVINFAEFGALN